MSDVNNTENQLPGIVNPSNEGIQTEIGGDDSDPAQSQNSNAALLGKVGQDQSESGGDGSEQEIVKEQTQEFVDKNEGNQLRDNNRRTEYKDRDPADLVSS
jgi:hypothetical protein